MYELTFDTTSSKTDFSYGNPLSILKNEKQRKIDREIKIFPFVSGQFACMDDGGIH